MRDRLLHEAGSLLAQCTADRISSIYFGGGTPSLVLPQTIGRLIEFLHQTGAVTSGAEVTLEINPTVEVIPKLREFQTAGINRFSVGMQALDDETLKFFNRNHTVSKGLRCLEACLAVEPTRTSVDVIYGRPGQTVQDWRTELKQLMSLCGSHVALYELTVERGTPLYHMVRDGLVTLPCRETMADLYETAVQTMKEGGLERYEASNFAVKGCESRHNMWYWMGGNYLGVGPGAHGRYVCKNGGLRLATVQTPDPNSWMKEVGRNGHATRLSTKQTTLDIAQELVACGLRTSRGVNIHLWNALLPELPIDRIFENLKHLISDEFVELSAESCRATDKGIFVIDSFLPSIIRELNLLSSDC